MASMNIPLNQAARCAFTPYEIQLSACGKSLTKSFPVAHRRRWQAELNAYEFLNDARFRFRPALIGGHEADDGLKLEMERVEGVTLAAVRELGGSHYGQALEALGATVASLHSLDCPALGDVARPSPEQLVQSWLRTSERVKDLSEFSSLGNEIRSLQRAIESYGPRVASTRPMALIHRDLRHDNVILDGAGHAVLIDWEVSTLGHPDFDLTRLYWLELGECRNRIGDFLRGYQNRDCIDDEQRLKFFRALFALEMLEYGATATRPLPAALRARFTDAVAGFVRRFCSTGSLMSEVTASAEWFRRAELHAGLGSFPAQLSARTCSVHGVRFELSTDDSRDLSRLAAYLHTDEAEPAVATYRMCRRTIEHPDRLHAFVLATATWRERVETYAAAYRTHCIVERHDQRIDAFIDVQTGSVVTRTGAQIDLWLARGSRDADAEMLRCVREVLYRRLLRDRHLAFHAGALVHGDGHAYMLVGPSGSGKTTALMSSVSIPDVAYLCNDRAMVRSSDRTVRHLPLPLRVAAGTAMCVPALAEHVKMAKPLHRAQTLRGSDLAIAARDWTDGRKLELSSQELATFTNCKTAARAPLQGIIIPSIVPWSRRPHIERATYEHALQALRSELRSPNDPLWPSPWLEPGTASDTAGEEVTELATRVPAWNLTFGTNWQPELTSFLRRWFAAQSKSSNYG